MRILIVEDDVDMSNLIKTFLEIDGWDADQVYSGEEGLEWIRGEAYDLVLLDVMLPGNDGYWVVEEVRKFSTLPIIMLTARLTDEDKVKGLAIGADDYLTKPFKPKELYARIKAHYRRAYEYGAQGRSSDQEVRVVNDLVLDYHRRSCVFCGEVIDLAPMEYDLLWKLMDCPGQVYPTRRFLKRCGRSGILN